MRLLVLVIVLLALLAGTARASTTYPELDAVASWLALRPVEVRCLTQEESDADMNIAIWGAAAYVDVIDGRPSDYAVFSYGLCEKLLSIIDGSWRYRYTLSSLGWAVLVIAHESGHLRGHDWWLSESRTNCWALRHVRYTALRLGVSDDLALGIRSWALWWYLHQPPEYQLEGCNLPSLDPGERQWQQTSQATQPQ